MAYFDDFAMQDELDVDRFIREATYTIWDLKMVGAIYDCYMDDCVIHAAAGTEVRGADAIVADTMAWISAFPDIKTVIMDVIWCGNAKDGYRVSMPWYYEGTNTGYTEFGPPTGKKMTKDNNFGIANTHIKKVDGRWLFVEEWSTYDKEAKRLVCTPDPQPE